ncbi:PF07274 domain protein [Schaalia georgiae F0490]|uniref:PF07274 domain protein n=1 Tax=Schaalia georgiae F0490 TaxID=1125717 RepID=J0XBW5_9ACTO|nr:PF07274 domain protein [Schaalia georgiae F0490]
MPFLVHFAFSTGFTVVYCVLAERFPQVKLWQGAAFGILVSSGLTSCSCPPRASSLPPGTSPSPSTSRSSSATSSGCG